MHVKNTTPRRPASGLALMLAALSLGAAAQAQTATTPSMRPEPGRGGMPASQATGGAMAQPMGKVAAADRQFMQKAAIGGMAEVELGGVAEQKAANAQVKEFASRMVQDHSKANDELKQIASTKGVELPAKLDAKHQRDMERLSKLSGAQFDRQYMQHMMADHRMDIADYRKASKSKDADLAAFASKTLPTLQEHAKMAQTTAMAVGAGGKGMNHSSMKH